MSVRHLFLGYRKLGCGGSKVSGGLTLLLLPLGRLPFGTTILVSHYFYLRKEEALDPKEGQTVIVDSFFFCQRASRFHLPLIVSHKGVLSDWPSFDLCQFLTLLASRGRGEPWWPAASCVTNKDSGETLDGRVWLCCRPSPSPSPCDHGDRRSLRQLRQGGEWRRQAGELHGLLPREILQRGLPKDPPQAAQEALQGACGRPSFMTRIFSTKVTRERMPTSALFVSSLYHSRWTVTLFSTRAA